MAEFEKEVLLKKMMQRIAVSAVAVAVLLGLVDVAACRRTRTRSAPA
jgi:hypothetical protein